MSGKYGLTRIAAVLACVVLPVVSERFERPAAGKLQLAAGELMLILQGIRLASVKHRKRFSRLAK